jgi:hypothetical protein
MMEDSAAVESARIPVENIKGPVLCVSAKQDEMWPSTEMSDEVMNRLDAHRFPYVHEHLVVDGGHNESLDYFDKITEFLLVNFPPRTNN